jgi:V/A-type H+-transporting ATPase subunit E
MTGLEKILKHIEDDANANAQAILAEANSKAEEIADKAKKEADEKCAGIAEKSKQDVQSCMSRAESTAALQEKKLILHAKQEIIGDVINRAKETLLQLPDKEYFDVILKMVKKYALGQTGQILFSPTDKKRVPELFDVILNTELSKIDGAKLSVSNETRNIDGGFILIYGEIEVNCSLDALFFAAKETLQDKVCEVLFV